MWTIKVVWARPRTDLRFGEYTRRCGVSLDWVRRPSMHDCKFPNEGRIQLVGRGQELHLPWLDLQLPIDQAGHRLWGN